MPVIKQKLISRADLKANPLVLYLFGDNEARIGIAAGAGQAHECRGEPNAVGIRTKRAPGRADGDYWYDSRYDRNVSMMTEDFERVCVHLANGGIAVLPLDGIGTGHAELAKRAPQTFQWLQSLLDNLTNFRIIGK